MLSISQVLLHVLYKYSFHFQKVYKVWVIIIPFSQMRKGKYLVVRKYVPINDINPKASRIWFKLQRRYHYKYTRRLKWKITDSWWRWAPRTFTPLLMGVLIGIPCLKAFEISKIKHVHTSNSAVPLIRNIFTCVQRDIYKNVHSTIFIRAKTWKQPKCLSVIELCVFVQWNIVKQCKWTNYSYIQLHE